MPDTLKVCPFCGSEAEYRTTLHTIIRCKNCRTYIRLHDDDDPAPWNTRTDLNKWKRSGIVQGVKACPFCGGFPNHLCIQERLIMCDCGIVHGLGIMHNGPIQEVLDDWNKRIPYVLHNKEE